MNVQPAACAKHVGPVSMPAMREARDFCQSVSAATASHGIEQRSACTGGDAVPSSEHQSQTAKGLQAWKRMASTARAKAGCLYDFLKSRNALPKDGRGAHFPRATVAQLEWAIEDKRPPRGHYAKFLEARGNGSTKYVSAEGFLSAAGAAMFRRILEDAGLPVPPVAESEPAWQRRMWPFIERWYAEDPSERRSLIDLVEQESPGCLSTRMRKMKLAGVEFYLMRRDFDDLTAQQKQQYVTRNAFAQTKPGLDSTTLGQYVGNEGDLPPESALKRLVPPSLRRETRKVRQESGPQADWLKQVRPLVEGWWASPEGKSLKEYVQGSLPTVFWIARQDLKLAALHFHMIHTFPDPIVKRRSECYLHPEAFAYLQGVKYTSFLHYVLSSTGDLQPRGEHLRSLVPASLLQQSSERSRAAGLGPRAEPGGESAARSAGALAATQAVAASEAASASGRGSPQLVPLDLSMARRTDPKSWDDDDLGGSHRR